MRVRTPTKLVGALFLIAASAAGCGGEGEGSGARQGPPGEITKAEYIREADATCERQSQRILQRRAQFIEQGVDRGASHTALETRAVREILASALGYEIRRVRLIVLPLSDVDQVLRFLEVWQEVVDRAEERPAAFLQMRRPFAKPEGLARAYGFEVCGSLVALG